MEDLRRINILIPLGGMGKRFSDAGYNEIKPYIKVIDDSMIRTVVGNLHNESAHFIFVINEEHISVDEFKRHISDMPISHDVISTPKLTEGPACTALLAQSIINTNDPLIIVNCDQIILDYDLNVLSKFASNTACDGFLGCFLSSSKKNSYVKLDPNGEVCDVKEKIVISNIATNGLHYWKRGSDFVESSMEMIEANDRYNSEFYVAPSYNYLIKRGKKILPYFFNLHFPIGTPEDLEIYKNKIANGSI
jgi:dTDP-glucose pyrophosphorylase